MSRNKYLKEWTVSEQIEKIKAEMCDKYCKHLEKLEEYLEADEAQQTLEEEYCAECPLTRL